MIDPITVFHPGIPNSTCTQERGWYRKDGYLQGWRTNDDPYESANYLTPGAEVDFAAIEADAGTINGNAAPIEFSSSWRVSLPLLQQPIDLVCWAALASVTSASTFSVGLIPVAGLASSLNLRGIRQYLNVPTAAAGLGTPVMLRHRVPAGTVAGDWTIAGIRDAGTGTGQLRANTLYSGGLQALAA